MRKVVLLALFLTATIAFASMQQVKSQPEEYMHHKWKINKSSLSVTVDADESEVRDDLNKLMDFIEDIVGSLKNDIVHGYVGEVTSEYIYIAMYHEIDKDIKIDADLYRTIDDILDWLAGEKLYLSDIADELEFSIPEKSVIPITYGEISQTMGIDMLGIIKTNTPCWLGSISNGFNLYIAGLLVTIYNKILDAEEYMTIPSTTIPLSRTDFTPGQPVGDPDEIKDAGDQWEELNEEVEDIDFSYEESDGKAIFTAEGSTSEEGVDISVELRMEYSLDSGLLMSLEESLSMKGLEDTIYTAEYEDVDLEYDFSYDFKMSHEETTEIPSDWKWTDYGEPLAYKISEIQISSDLQQLLEEVYEEPPEEAEGWHISTEYYHSPSHSWYTGEYTNDAYWVLESPTIDVSGYSEVNLSFYTWYDTEEDFDYCRVYVILDSTETSVANYTGYSFGWEYMEYLIPTGGASTMKIKFVLESDESITYDGWAIDDITVKAGDNILFEDDVESGNIGWTTNLGLSSQYISPWDLLKNFRAIFWYDSNPTGFDAVYWGELYYYNKTTDQLELVDEGYAYGHMLTAGSLRVMPDTGLLYGQMQFNGIILTEIIPKFLKIAIHVAEKEEGMKMPSIDVSGDVSVLECEKDEQSWFALLDNISFSVDYSNPEPGLPAFSFSGSMGVWYVYKGSGYLVESGIEAKITGKVDTDMDGSLDDEESKTYTVKVVVNKVVAVKKTSTQTSVAATSSGWEIQWDKLDADPPSFSSGEWKDVTPYKVAKKKRMIITVAVAAVAIVAIVAVVMILRRRKQREF